MVHPNDKILVGSIGGVRIPGSQTNAEVHLAHLSAEVLRDLARNESASKEWRKAAVELLLEKQHPHANHSDLRELVLEIKAEREARAEVEALAHQEEEFARKLVNDAVETVLADVDAKLSSETEQTNKALVNEALEEFNKATEDKRVYDNGLPVSEGKQIKFYDYNFLKPETLEEVEESKSRPEDTEQVGA